MPRVARNTFKTNLFHVIQKSPFTIFKDETDRRAFVDILGKAKSKYQFNCYGFSCCMSDRFELIIHVKHQNISKIMQTIMIAYSKYFNHPVSLFPTRYKSFPLYTYDDVILSLGNLNEGLALKGSQICFYTGKDTSYKLIDFFTHQSIDIDEKKDEMTIDQVLKTFIQEQKCNQYDIKQNPQLRNQCILKIYLQTGCTIKTIANLFNLSPSMISKILKNEAK